MNKEFKSLQAFSNHIKRKVVSQYDRREHALLETVGKFVEKESKKIIGHRQYGAGAGLFSYGFWPELAESTQEEKERLGYGNAGNDWQPLLRTGVLRDSIGYSVSLHNVYVGSNDDIMIYQEMGTARIPARPVLGLAMYREKFKIQKAVGNFLYAWITATRAKGKIE